MSGIADIERLSYFLSPQTFLPETTDVYDRKNLPRLVFCLHALGVFLYKLGVGPPMTNLEGKVSFTEDEVSKECLMRFRWFKMFLSQVSKMQTVLDELPSEGRSAVPRFNEFGAAIQGGVYGR